MDIGEFGEDRPDIPLDFKLQARQEACSLGGINSVLRGELFGLPEVNDLNPSRDAHGFGPFLPGMRRRRTSSPLVPPSRLRTPSSGDRLGPPEPTHLGRAGGEGIQQRLYDELSAGGAIQSKEGS